jgi:hypothetical protein
MLEQIVKTDQALQKLPMHLKLPTGSSNNGSCSSSMQDAATAFATAEAR